MSTRTRNGIYILCSPTSFTVFDPLTDIALNTTKIHFRPASLARARQTLTQDREPGTLEIRCRSLPERARLPSATLPVSFASILAFPVAVATENVDTIARPYHSFS
jgi:hypothetical protein